jgi:hypothetical protein
MENTETVAVMDVKVYWEKKTVNRSQDETSDSGKRLNRGSNRKTS